MTAMGYRILNGRENYVQALRDGVSLALDQNCREMWWSDADFADWPLSEPAVLEALTAWCLPHRRLVMVALNYDTVQHSHSRFVQWRRNFSHVIDARQVIIESDDPPVDLPSVLLVPGQVTVRLFDRSVWRSSQSHEVGDCVRARDLIDAIAQRSMPALAISTLGL